MRRFVSVVTLVASAALPLGATAHAAITTQIIQGKVIAAPGQSAQNFRIALVAAGVRANFNG
jgi:hypothetical protein